MNAKVSFHGGHSGEYSAHATGALRDVLQAYVSSGFSHVGISEHIPSKPGFLYPDEIELGAEALEARIKRLFMEARSGLHQEFDSDLQLFVGFETEYYGPEPLAQIQSAIEQFKPEVIVASVHHVRDIPIDLSPESYQKARTLCGGMEELWGTYLDQQLDLFGFLQRYSQEIPVVAGHFDLLRLLGREFCLTEAVWERIRRNVARASEVGIVFEVNSRALKKGLAEPYPSLPILQEIRRQGGSITFGDDSHGPRDVGLYLAEAQAFAAQVFTSAVAFERSGSGYEKRDFAI